MDFKISAGAGQQGKCPECGKKVLPMLRGGVKMLVCSCGWKQILKKYPQNSVNLKQISKR
jgi:DNA-directed RNA polymerase subunit RPC12/RpoP